MPVTALISLFEELDRSRSTSPVLDQPATPPRLMDSPFTTLRSSLRTTFQGHVRYPSTLSSPSTSVSCSPVSSYGSSKRYSFRSSSPMTLRSASRRASSLIRRRPSTIDIALEQERHASYAEQMGLNMMEPRPYAELPVAPECASMSLFGNEENVKQSFVMGSIFEVIREEC